MTAVPPEKLIKKNIYTLFNTGGVYCMRSFNAVASDKNVKSYNAVASDKNVNILMP
jgi:hypothetical protein